jgi:hypothetical protein
MIRTPSHLCPTHTTHESQFLLSICVSHTSSHFHCQVGRLENFLRTLLAHSIHTKRNGNENKKKFKLYIRKKLNYLFSALYIYPSYLSYFLRLFSLFLVFSFSIPFLLPVPHTSVIRVDYIKAIYPFSQAVH